MAKMFELNEWVDTSEKYDDPVKWIAHSIAAYTVMMSLDFPDEFKEYTWGQRRDALKVALKETLAGIENGTFSSFTYSPKEHVYTLRAWWLEGILDFLFSDEKIWTSKKWTIEEVRKHTPKALAHLIGDIKED